MTDTTSQSPTEVMREIVDAWPDVLKIIRDYDESFPYAQLEGDDEACTRLNVAIRNAKALVNEYSPS